MEKPWLSHYEQGVPPVLQYPRIALSQLLEDSACRHAGRPAIRLLLGYGDTAGNGRQLTYRQLLDQVNRFAAAMHALGVRRGDRIALMLPNLPQFVISFFGGLKLGAVIVNTNPTYTPREMAYQFSTSGAETVVLLNTAYPKFQQIQAAVPVKRVIVTAVTDYAVSATAGRAEEAQEAAPPGPAGVDVHPFCPLLDAHPETPPEAALTADDVALLQYTGGTTGTPKAAELTHYNLVVNALQMRHWLTGLEEGRERVLAALPLFHVYGMTVAMNVAFTLGAELLLMPNPRPISEVMRALHSERVTLFPGVPAMYIGIIHHPEVAQYDLRSVKACISGAAPLPMEVQLRFEELTGGRLVEGYGLTEASPVTHCNPVHGLRKAGSIGVPLPDVEAKIVDHETLAERPSGEVGELWVRGPQVMRGYWNQPAATAQALTPDGWLRTGDIARMDADGYFYIVDRLKDMINVSGYKVIPREVEEILYEHPQVQEAVVAGVPDARWGESVKAYIVLKPGETSDPAAIMAWCAERLAPYKVPRAIEFRTELPKTAVGKYLRRALVEAEGGRST